jgi:hypothetical protein
MKYRQNNDPLRFYTEINTIRKTSCGNATYIIIYQGIDLRPFRRERKTPLDF